MHGQPHIRFLSTVRYNTNLLKSVETSSLNSPQFSPFVQSRAVTIARHVKLKACRGVALSDGALLCSVSHVHRRNEMKQRLGY